ncbi:hypothetical protein [Bacillus marasmi]|uniref:hypothetical protein n=1 Tax=Bacillus marasmi TaxID=1926279 RepID=UPI0011CACDC9|nr:hypothetical protein [Bacillus marasmi]
MNLIELEKVEEALRSDKITFAEAGEKIYGSTTKPWQTEHWKKKRNELIKDSCEQCGSTKPQMVLQHMWHPSSYRTHVRIAYESFLEDEKLNNSLPDVKDEEVQIYLDQFTDTKESCPSCGVRSISKRKTMKPTYRCAKCYHEFDEPKMVPYHPKLGVAPSFNDLKRGMANRRLQDYIWDTYGDKIRKKAILQGIEEHKRYISLEDTKTFCKRCAFLWDRKRKKVCDVCKDTLIPIQMHACYKCQKDGHPGVL